VKQLLSYMDTNDDINLYEYMFLRRVSLGMRSCSDVSGLSPNKIYCFLSIAVPRLKNITITEESMYFKASMILTYGSYTG